MIPIVYRWDDSNAPVARGERRSLCDILYACLVTGYGTKLPAGWTREYVNATFDKAAFRNNPDTGTGFYLQVDGAGATYAYQSKIMGYEVMTNVDAGLFPFSSTALGEWYISNAAGTTARPWVLVADERAFYFTCWRFASAAVTPTNADINKNEIFFGDIIKWSPDDNYACLLNAGVSLNTYGLGLDISLRIQSTSSGNGTIKMPRKANGSPGSIVPAIICGGGPGAEGNVSTNNINTPGVVGMPFVNGDPILISRPYINDSAAYTLRGWLPGFYYPCHNSASFQQLSTQTVDGKSYLVINGYLNAGYVGGYFISLDDWRA
ncbi:MAG: hypothetical protein FP810_18475 [Desulfocapsa sp.]|nr:hypothetical protein [Desulfocapsa sp.]MBU4108139.1 hypothetical protein [Pseudomonadota bacterium]MCG2744276.1 hypothetical protein [Desulfobacteraceae bacterium]